MVKTAKTLRKLIDQYRRDPADLTVEELRTLKRWQTEVGGSVHRITDLRRKNKDTRDAQDIADELEALAVGENPNRRDAAIASFRVFCETYFPTVYYLEWSDDHLRILGKIDGVASSGGLFAYAMPRGSGKSTLARTAALWSILSGRRRYVCLIGSASGQAKMLLQGIRSDCGEPPAGVHSELHSDFWRELGPFVALGNNAHKQKGQRYDGNLTSVQWESDRLVFGTVPDSRCGGSVITVAGLDSNIRGQQFTHEGTILRPDLVLLDDPQTRESAYSHEQTRRRMEILSGDVLGMAGPGKTVAAFLTCTKIVEGDFACQVLDKEKCPDWQGECTKMLHTFPANMKIWDQYDHLRIEGIRSGVGPLLATAFYAENRDAMDDGAVAAWEARYDARAGEISAIQHAMNLYLRPSEAGGGYSFMAEYQNEPATKQDPDTAILTPAQVAERFNGRKRGEVPLVCSKITGFIDLHKGVLYWCVAAWQQENFTGFVIDYGTMPDQRRNSFTLANATRTLGRAFPGMGEDGAIQAGLERLVEELLRREWPRAGGGVLRIDRLNVDMGYKSGIVAAVKHKSGGSAMTMAKGVGIKAGNKPISMYQRKPGWTLGHNWYVPSVTGTREFPHVCVDVNYWKSFVHERLAVAPGDPGAMTLFGKGASEHLLFAEHLAGSETYVVTSGQGRQVQEWRQRPERPDNHWLDCLVGCAAAASMIGVKLLGLEGVEPQRRQRKRYTQADLARK